MTVDVFSWWSALCAVAALNIAAWAASAVALERRQGRLGAEGYASRRLQLLLSAGYVFGCAFRCAYPVYDVQRTCIVDSWLSSVIIGRSIATVAELCFVAQWALLLREVSHSAHSSFGKVASAWIVPMIVVAELCSWYSVLTTSNLGHVFEESIWAFSAAIVVASLVAIWPRCQRALRPLLAVCCAGGFAYVAYMVSVDVPMYWARWVSDEASGRGYFSLVQGALDASACWNVSHRWEDWKSEVVWMSLYFSVAVWLSIAMVHSPPARQRHL
jgi:hypothetical protein